MRNLVLTLTAVFLVCSISPIATVSAQTQRGAAGSGPFEGRSAQGLPQWRGATVLLNGSSELSSRLYPGMDRAAVQQMWLDEQNLMRLYQLRANPALIDAPNRTADYLWLLTGNELARYAGFDGTRYRWKGTNQFEAEDARKAFLSNHRTAILARTKSLPTELVELVAMTFDRYNEQTGHLGIHLSLQSTPQNTIGRISRPIPFTAPRTWAMRPEEARGLFEQMKAQRESGTRGIAAIRYKVVGDVTTDGGAILDTVASEFSFYDIGLQRKIADVPFPPGAITVNRPRIDAPAAGVIPELDAIYPVLWAVAEDPRRLDDRSFLIEAFQIRRVHERQKWQEHPSGPISFPLFIGTAMLSANASLPPDEAHLQATRTWLKAHASNLSKRVVLSDMTVRAKTGQPVADLANSLGVYFSYVRNGPEWRIGNNTAPWAVEARRSAGAALPNSAGVIPISVGEKARAMIALHPNMAWAGVELPFGVESTFGQGALQLEVLDAKTLTASGGTVLLFDVRPTSLTLNRAGKEHRIPFNEGATVQASAAPSAAAGPSAAVAAPASPSSPASPGASYDAANVVLGMPLAKAEAAARAFIGKTVERVEGGTHFAPLADAIVLREPGAKGTSSKGELVVLFFDKTLPERPVIAIGRKTKIESSRSFQELLQALVAQLSAKYGKPVSVGRHPNDRTYWTRSPVAARDLVGPGEYKSSCSTYHFNNFPNVDPPSKFTSMGFFGYDIRTIKDCGEVASIVLYQDKTLLQFVTNTALYGPKLTREAALKPPAAPEQKVKF